jgi:hypothetical protein
LTFLFGSKFTEFRSIVVPIGVGQILAAPASGLILFLKAGQRGRALLWLNTLNAVLFLVSGIVFGSLFGLKGAAWAGVVAGAGGGVALIAVLRTAMRTP